MAPLPARALGAGLGLTGLLVLVLGTFLPWLRSGQARRNSYQTSGALHRLLGLPGSLDTALSAWPFVALACAAAVALFALGLHRTAAATALGTGAVSAAVSVVALNVDGTAFAAPVRLGPAVTLTGATVVLAAASVVLVSRRTRRDGEGATP